MRLTIRPVIAALLMSSVAISLAADDRRGVENQYAKLKSAYWHKDYRKALSVFGTNFTWTKPMGEVVSYGDFAAGMRKQLSAPGLEFDVVDVKNDSYDFTGDEARVRSSKHLAYSQRIDGRRVNVHTMMQTVDTWRRAASGQWLLYKIEVLNQTQENDG